MLTEKRIRDAVPGPRAFILWDRKVTGLGCRVFPSGKKAFVLSYRTGNQKRLATLARVGEISLAEARERAGRDLAAIRDGETDPLKRRRDARDAPTVTDGVTRFFEAYAPRRVADGRMTKRTVHDYRKQAELTILPALGRMKIKNVTRQDVERAVAPRAPVQRNRTLALISRLFNLFDEWGWRAQGTNPAQRIERARERPRDRVLAPSELTALAKALDEMERQNPFAVAAIRCAALTGLRISECLAMRWCDLSFEDRRATLPATKTGRRVVPLAAPVVELLDQLPRVNGNDFVFASNRGGAMSYEGTRRIFRKTCKIAGLEGVRLHDLRRTLATRLAASGVNAYILRDALGHSTLTMANRYVRMAGDALADATEQAAQITADAMAGKDRRDG